MHRRCSTASTRPGLASARDKTRGALRQLHEAVSGRAVRPVGRKRVDGRPDGRKRRRCGIGGRQDRQATHHGARRTARTADIALVLVCGINLAFRGDTRLIKSRRARVEAQMFMCCGGPMISMGMDRGGRPVRQGCSTAAMMRWPTERHGSGRDTLSRDRDCQQPDQQRSDQQIHLSTLTRSLTQARPRHYRTTPGGLSHNYRVLQLTARRQPDDKAVIFLLGRDTCPWS